MCALVYDVKTYGWMCSPLYILTMHTQIPMRPLFWMPLQPAKAAKTVWSAASAPTSTPAAAAGGDGAGAAGAPLSLASFDLTALHRDFQQTTTAAKRTNARSLKC